MNTILSPMANTTTRKHAKRRPRLVSVRRFNPTPEDRVGQHFDPTNQPVADVLDLIARKFDSAQRAALRTTIGNALKLDAQGYTLLPVGQLLYEVHGGQRVYVYDHGTETCSCPLHEVLGTCKHSVWAVMKIEAAVALLGEAPSPPVHRFQPVNPWGEVKPAAPVRSHRFPVRGTAEYAAQIARDF